MDGFSRLIALFASILTTVPQVYALLVSAVFVKTLMVDIFHSLFIICMLLKVKNVML